MDQGINSAVCDVVLGEPINFPLVRNGRPNEAKKKIFDLSRNPTGHDQQNNVKKKRLLPQFLSLLSLSVGFLLATMVV